MRLNDFIIIGFLSLIGCKDHVTDKIEQPQHKMYVFSNYSNTFYLVNYKTYEVEKEIQLSLADTIICGLMTLSTNRDYLFFGAENLADYPATGYVTYNIKEEKQENLFFTGFSHGIGYFVAAGNASEPGLIYAHFRDLGMLSIDLFEQKVKEVISNEHDFTLDKRIFHSPDKKWIIIKKNWEAIGYTELEFYNSSSGLKNVQFVLNKSNVDSLRIYDWVFSNEKKLFIMYLPGPTRDNRAFLGSYDLNTTKVFRSSLSLPWSLSGYYLSYNSIQNEIYAAGSNGIFYIIDPNSYSLKDSIILSRGGEQSRIVLTPDNTCAFISYSSSESIIVIDLTSRKVIKTISVKGNYYMIIP
jgi:DNA-binding beta-propeller fold protein YncE